MSSLLLSLLPLFNLWPSRCRLHSNPGARQHVITLVGEAGFGAFAFAELRLRSATRPLTAGLRLTAFSSLFGRRGLPSNPATRQHVITLVGEAGFEPATSCSQSKRASQTALLPDNIIHKVLMWIINDAKRSILQKSFYSRLCLL